MTAVHNLAYFLHVPCTVQANAMHVTSTCLDLVSQESLQVDLRLEAHNLWRFNQNFSRDRLVSLPMPLYPWVSQDILVQSFEEGMHISGALCHFESHQ